MKKRGLLLVGDYSEFQAEYKMVAQLFEKMNIEMTPVNYCDILVFAENHEDASFFIKDEKQSAPDFVLTMTVREREDYQLKAVLRMFEELGVPCINTYDAVEKVGDKLYSFQIAARAVPELAIPKTMLIGKGVTADIIEEQIGLPVILKVMHGNQGVGVSMVKTKEELKNLLNIVTAAEFGDEMIAQQAILSSAGKDLRVVIIGDQFVHAFVRCNDNDFKSNLHQGGRIEEYNPSEKLIENSLALAKAYGLKLCSIDYLFGEKEDEFYLCEANSIPGISYLFKEQKEGSGEILRRFMGAVVQLLEKEGVLTQ